MNNFKVANFSKNSHIYGEYISENLCDDIINFFNENKSFQKEGVIDNNIVDKFKKDSTDMYVTFDQNDIFKVYSQHLKHIINNYINLYIGNVFWKDEINFSSTINIQFYKSNEGFKFWHYERGPLYNKRVLVFMTYLNTVFNGGTHFDYQNMTVAAEKGLTLIWPAEFTHKHKGQISPTDNKYIITGWIEYV